MPRSSSLNSLKSQNLIQSNLGERIYPPPLPLPGALARRVVGGSQSVVVSWRASKTLKNLRKIKVFASWGYLGPSWGDLGPSWRHLALYCASLGPSWGYLGPLWAILGPDWGHLGPILGLSGGDGPPKTLMFLKLFKVFAI